MYLVKYLKIRAANSLGNLEMAVPAGCTLEKGQRVLVVYDGFILAVPDGAEIDQAKLQDAIKIRREE